MKITVDEMVDINNRTKASQDAAYRKGIEDERSRELPSTLFDTLINYGKETKTLIDYHKSSSETDGCNWIQIKPNRDGSEGIKHVEISFEENLMEIHHIGIGE